MTPTANIYTHTLPLHRNLILGSARPLCLCKIRNDNTLSTDLPVSTDAL